MLIRIIVTLLAGSFVPSLAFSQSYSRSKAPAPTPTPTPLAKQYREYRPPSGPTPQLKAGPTPMPMQMQSKQMSTATSARTLAKPSGTPIPVQTQSRAAGTPVPMRQVQSRGTSTATSSPVQPKVMGPPMQQVQSRGTSTTTASRTRLRPAGTPVPGQIQSKPATTVTSPRMQGMPAGTPAPMAVQPKPTPTPIPPPDVKAYLDRQLASSKDQKFHLTGNGKDIPLTPFHFWPQKSSGPNSTTTCVDMRSDNGTVYDIDFLTTGTQVSSIRVHRINGESVR